MDKLHVVGAAINAVGRLSPGAAGRLALKLFMEPRRIAISPDERRFLAAADPVALDFGEGLAVFTVPAGGPRPGGESVLGGESVPGGESAPMFRGRALLIHGWESHAGRWIPLMRRLSAGGLECVAFDGPAAGQSGGRRTPFNYYVDAALAVEAAYGPFDAVIGHSLGGGVAVQVLARVPASRRPSHGVVMASFDESEHVFARYLDMLAYAPHVRVAFDREVDRLLARLNPGRRVADYSNTAALRGLGDVAGLVIHSEDDAVCPIAESVALHRAWPGSRLATFADAGHGLRGGEVLAAIGGHLANI